MKNILMLLIFVSATVLFAAEESQTFEYKSYSLEIVVTNTDEVVDDLISKARENKGVVMNYSSHYIQVRIPAKSMDRFLEQVKRTGYLDDETQTSEDMGEELATLRARLKVKEDYVSKLYALAASATLGGTLDAERAIAAAATDIDQMKSDIRTRTRMVKYYDVTIQIMGPGTLPKSAKSRYDFINGMGIEKLTAGSYE